jgi:phytoene dehydrogenase-like protein
MSSTVSLLPDGRALVLYSDAKKAAQEIAPWSQKDASAYADFGTALGKIGKVIGEALALTPPNIDRPSSGDLWGMLKTGRSIRNLGKKDLYRVLRWGPMAVADLVAEFFDTEPLRATIAARGIFGTCLGPGRRAARSCCCCALQPTRHPPAAGSVQFPAGGAWSHHPGDGSGGEAGGRRNSHRRRHCRDSRARWRCHRRRAHLRRRDFRARRRLERRSQTHPDAPGRSRASRARLHSEDQNYRSRGTVAKINLALSALPEFTALKRKGNLALLQGRIQISPEIDYLERAFDESKYGNFSRNPYLEITFPSLSDPRFARPASM